MNEKYKEMSFVELAELYRFHISKKLSRVMKMEELEKEVRQLGAAYKDAQKKLIEYQAAAVDTESQAILAELGVRIAAGLDDPDAEDPDTEDPDTETEKETDNPRRGRKGI